MRDRHFPRLCRACSAPLARQEGACWRCGTQWAAEDGPRTTLKVVAGGAGAQVADRPPPPMIAGAAGAQVADRPRPMIAVTLATSEACLDADRWTNEGGSFESKRQVAAVS
jgi:hypothetical protein